MPIKTYRPTTQTLRYRTTLVNDDITTQHPHKPLLETKQRTGGRRNSGDTTMWHRGGGHKKKLRLIDFKRDKSGIPANKQRIIPTLAVTKGNVNDYSDKINKLKNGS